MTPPMNDIITPTGHIVRSFLPLDGKKPNTAELYFEQLERMRELAERASASRAAYLFAPMSEQV